MNTTRFHASTIRTLLKKQKIATIDELKAALGSQTSVTVFRKLAELSYLISYSHGARYHTLEEIAQFNQDGFWSCDSVWFSSHGTLLSTLERFIDSAEAGHYGPELRERLHVEVNSSLLKLITQGKVLREKVDGMYLYCSADPVIHERQLASREIAAAREGTRGIILSNDWVSDEIKAAIILFFSLLDEDDDGFTGVGASGKEDLQKGHQNIQGAV